MIWNDQNDDCGHLQRKYSMHNIFQAKVAINAHITLQQTWRSEH